MEKYLNYFSIGGAFGGSQDWFKNIVMHVGGCAAATACDSLIYLGKTFNKPEFYPYDLNHLNKEDYLRFSQSMKPYIKPRIRGVYKLKWYKEGMTRYLDKIGARIPMEEFSGEHTYEEAYRLVKEQIDKEYPIPCLLLKHQDQKQFEDFIWHWFLIVGYQEITGDILVKTATYGQARVFSLKELWDTGEKEKGGFIRYLNI